MNDLNMRYANSPIIGEDYPLEHVFEINIENENESNTIRRLPLKFVSNFHQQGSYYEGGILVPTSIF